MPGNFHGLVKLTNGEELITKILNDDGAHYTFEDPVIMYRHMAPNGTTWIQCSHWLLFNKVSVVRVHKDKVLALVDDLHENVITNYENFLKGGYAEMEHRHEAERQKWLDQVEDSMNQAMAQVGGANTTYH